MSDSMKATVSEVAKDIKDSVGEMIEQGVQSITAPLTPQQIQQSKQQDQKDLVEARRKIEFYKNLKMNLGKEAQATKQKENQRIQVEQQEVQAKKVEKIQINQKPKKPGLAISEEVARTRQEIGKGHGIGG